MKVVGLSPFAISSNLHRYLCQELEGKCAAISRCLAGEAEYDSSGEEESTGGGRVSKRRKTVEMEVVS